MSERDRFEEFMARWAPEYNQPPEAPREEIWEGIRDALWREEGESEKVVPLDGERRRRGGTPGRSWWWAAVGAAAVLVVGFGLGRLTAPGQPGTSGAVTGPAGVEGSGPFRTAALRHFSETESFLTLVRGDARAGRVDPGVARWAGGLLSETRLLLDSPAAEDPAVRTLLADLELVLVQVVGLRGAEEAGSARVTQELRLLTEGIDDHDVLSRLQAIMPETPVPIGL